MSLVAHFFREGGAFMYVILLTALICAASIVAQFLTLRLRFNALPLSVASLCGLFTSGLIGTVLGLRSTLAAVAMAAPDQKMSLVAMGFAESINNATFALFLLGLLLPFVGIAAAVRSALPPEKAS